MFYDKVLTTANLQLIPGLHIDHIDHTVMHRDPYICAAFFQQNCVHSFAKQGAIFERMMGWMTLNASYT